MTTAAAGANPELARRIRTGSFDTNCHDLGTQHTGQVPVLFIHGSGPGVSAWANWRLVMPVLAGTASPHAPQGEGPARGGPAPVPRRVLAPDMVGFGYTDRPAGIAYTMDTWVQQALDLLDVLDLPQVDLVGNSFGGALALALSIRAPQRVRRLVLMGSVGVPFTITPGLDAVWGYEPSFEAMRGLLDIFAYSRALVTDELAQLHYQASIRPGFQESFSAMFPAPRQRWVDAMASREADIRTLPHETLVIHGREDRVIPLRNSLTLAEWIPKVQLHVFGQCGHWTQIEHAGRFARLVGDFLAEADAA